MIERKNLSRIVAACMVLAVCLCLCAGALASSPAQSGGISMEYETALFDTEQVLSVNIIMEESDWSQMLENAIQEEYYPCDVQINGETFYRVGIRPKGNTSLSAIASDPTTDRYSFKLEFDQYVDGQTCHGLDKLILNNNYADATNMKEALIYDMFQYLGADASLYNYASVSVNGTYWGVYLALEAVEDSFLLRNYGTQSGALYKPEGMNIGGGNAPDMGNLDFSGMDIPDMDSMDFEDMDFSQISPPDGMDADFSPGQSPMQQPDAEAAPGQNQQMQPPQTAENQAGAPDLPDMQGLPDMPDMSDLPDMQDMPGRTDGGFAAFGAGGGASSGGADLNYTDDELDSYATIWDGEVTKTTDKDHKRVVTALKHAADGTELDTYLDVDNLLRYLAVHVFSVNEDSLTGSMAHNYYLYESDGRINLLPWDYNLALGGMNGGDASEVVNSPIDDAFSGTTFFDALLADETYHSRYDAYLQQLADEYIAGGAFEDFYTRTRARLDALVEADPTAFYDYDTYLTAVDTLYQTVLLRGTSISGQLDGSIPSTRAEQTGAQTLVDASSIDLSSMGVMNMGGGKGGFDRQEQPFAQTEDKTAETQTPRKDDQTDTQNREASTDEKAVPAAMFGRTDTNRTQNGTLLTCAISVGVLLIAFLFALLYRRRPQRR